MHTITLDKCTRVNGIAGQYAYDVTVTYHYPDAPSEVTRVTFIGSAYGAPVVMRHELFEDSFVHDWKRFGETLNPQWVRNFFGIRG